MAQKRLHRLTGAERCAASGESFLYDYDKVGNRTSMTASITSTAVTTYTYDSANRLTQVNGVTQTWDARGNLLEDFAGTEYTYDVGNRLVKAVQDGVTYEFVYNGLGDRLQQTVAGEVMTYTLDLFAGLTQVLWDGENLYLYPSASSGLGGLGRIGEEQPDGWAYHLADALGSVRQLADEDGDVTLARSFKPYGGLLESEGDGATAYDFAGEWRDGTGLVFLRARYLDPVVGRFFVRDRWEVEYQWPSTLHQYLYAMANPLKYTDPSGHYVQNLPGGASPPEPIRIRIEDAPILGDWGLKGLEIIIMPPGYRPEPRSHTLATGLEYLGAGADFLEMVTAGAAMFGLVSPALPDMLATGDIAIALGASYFRGETNLRFESLHPSLPEMIVIGQDVILTAGEAGFVIVTKAVLPTVGLATFNVPGVAAGVETSLLVDVTLSYDFAVYDYCRAQEIIPTYFAVGFYFDDTAGTRWPIPWVPPGQPTLALIIYQSESE